MRKNYEREKAEKESEKQERERIRLENSKEKQEKVKKFITQLNFTQNNGKEFLILYYRINKLLLEK